MINRRSILGISAAFIITGCAAPLIEETVSKGMKVDTVSVDVSSLKNGVTGRQFTASNDRVQADIRTALINETRTSPSGSRAVTLIIKLDSFRLVSPGQSALVGGISTIKGRATVIDTKTKEVIVPETTVLGRGRGYAPGGLISVIIAKKPTEDYIATVAGFAADVKLRVFGK